MEDRDCILRFSRFEVSFSNLEKKCSSVASSFVLQTAFVYMEETRRRCQD